MKMYPCEWEIYTDDLLDLIAEFKVIDEDSISVTINSKPLIPEDLIRLSKCLKKAYNQYNEEEKDK